MLQSVLETLPSFLLPRGAVRSSCDVSTMTCANNLTMDAQVMVGREERLVGRRPGTGLLPTRLTPGISQSWLQRQNLNSVHLTPSSFASLTLRGFLSSLTEKELSHLGPHFTQVTLSEALHSFSGNKISHPLNKTKLDS